MSRPDGIPQAIPLKAAERPFILTLDVGTSSVRTLLFDAAGRRIEAVGVQRQHAPDTTPDGGYEFNADALVERCLEVLAATAGQLDVTPDAVAVCTFWHSLVGVAADGSALTPVYLWADTRSRAYVARLRERLDERAAHARTGCLFHTSYLPVRLLWLHSEYPAVYARAARWLSFAEYLWLRLFGTPACSHSMASGTGLFNVNTLEWDAAVLNALDLAPERLGTLTDVSVPSTGMLAAVASRLGRLAAVPWFPALGDGACSNIGSGCVTPERPAVMIGTSGAMRTVWSVPSLTPPWGLWAYRVDRRRFVVGGALSNGGNLAQWLQENLRLDMLSAYDDALLAARPGAHGLTVLPFWAGERSPGWAADATGAVVGLRLNTRPVDILQAAMEAVAYRFSLILERLAMTVERIDSLVATGGALLRSRPWLQILADVFGRPVQISLEPEASSRGAALVALEALGVWKDLRDVPAAFGHVFEPRPEYHALHRELRAKHLELYRKLIGAG